MCWFNIDCTFDDQDNEDEESYEEEDDDDDDDDDVQVTIDEISTAGSYGYV